MKAKARSNRSVLNIACVALQILESRWATEGKSRSAETVLSTPKRLSGDACPVKPRYIYIKKIEQVKKL